MIDDPALAIFEGLASQWPFVGVILLTFWRGAKGAAQYVRDLEKRLDSALVESKARGERLERTLAEAVEILRLGVGELRDRTGRHSRIIADLSAVSTSHGERLAALEVRHTPAPGALRRPEDLTPPPAA